MISMKLDVLFIFTNTFSTWKNERNIAELKSSLFLEIAQNWSTNRFWLLITDIGEQGGGQGGFYPVWKFFLWPPSKIQNDPHPPQKWLLTPYKILSWRRFFFKEKTKKICPEKKISPAYAGTSSWPKRAKNSHKNFSVGPPWPPLF